MSSHETRFSRRALLRGGLAGAGALSLSAILSACGIEGSIAQEAANRVDWTKYWADQKKTGTLDFANWPLYIDQDHGKSKSLELFTKATGIAVDYKAVIQDNATFYATLSPQLRAHEATGYDIVVMTNGWELTEMIQNGFVVELDHSKLANFAKYAADNVKSPNYDPGNKHSVVWQTGFTGIAYNTKLIDHEITSFQDLLDPAFSGHVGMMSDNTELGSAALLAIGVTPSDSTPADWRRAAAWLKKQRPVVSGYYDQSYIDKLENGDTWISQAWSGDVFQAQQSGFPHIKFVTPKEGQMIWHDNMMIPRQASHPVDALEWMNFYYTPKIAGLVEDWVNYVCPVPGAKGYIAGPLDDGTVAKSPLIFPSDAVSAKSHEFYVYKNYDEYEEWNTVFNPIIQA
ncbi:ABC transporter substrate-binding protein [Frondihabitans sp. PAMC 28766]|uniref:polyamine ABC transporter substrate-binding protein n=1 Tax=Frondihabitans sp. PAMC 28766 TaxID=1795630 RepID=UPI00078EE75B|nr:spermidine/putrescine ABC transporter substrate-binding protein [Frondihabitans sp. PAMC 28766]AMM21350.1 ABC transporter substrate-binding protein [Frondihabitans sp. PAMC 28766]